MLSIVTKTDAAGRFGRGLAMPFSVIVPEFDEMLFGIAIVVELGV